MAALKHDSMGFLQGDPLDMARLTSLWGGMSEDLRVIRKAIEKGGAAGNSPASGARGAYQGAAVSQAARRSSTAANDPVSVKSSRSSYSAPQRQDSADQAAQQIAKQIQSYSKQGGAGGGANQARIQASQEASAQRQRGGNGRFTKGDGAGAEPAAGSGEGGLIKRLASAAVGTVKTAGEAESVEPAIKAFNEVAQPMARGYQGLFGGGVTKEEKRRDRWYRRFWTMLTKGNEQEAKDNKDQLKRLKAIEEKPVPGAGGRGGLMGGVMAAAMGMLAKMLLPLIGLLSVFKGGGGGIGALLKKGAFLGPLLKKVPMLGALLTVGGGLMDLFRSENSDMSRSDKDKASGKAAGGIGGALAGALGGAKLGMMIGTAFGPVGTAIGGAIGGMAGAFFGTEAGAIVGEKVGSWVNELRAVDIAGKFEEAGQWIKDQGTKTFDAIGAGWSAFMDTSSALWQGLVDKLNGVKTAVTEVAAAANDKVKQYTGVDVGANLKSAGEAVSLGAGRAVDAVKESSLGKGATAVVDKVQRKLKAHKNRTALIQEMDKQGVTNENERAMLMAQMDHESGGFSSMEESFKYRSAEALMGVSKTARNKGADAANAALKSGPEAVAELMYGGRMGNKNPGDAFKFRGRGAVQLTGADNYAEASKDLGIDLVSNPDAVANDPEVSAKVAMWYWKKRKLSAAAQEGNVTSVTKTINGGDNGLADRKELYKGYLASGVASPAPAGVSVAANSVAVAAAPSTASAPIGTPNAAPQVPTSVAVASGGGNRGSATPTADPSQDMQDRRLAHLATGGLSA